MGARRLANRAIVSLLVLLLLGAPAATQTAEYAAREARTAFDRAQYGEAMRIIDAALQRFGSQQNGAVWTLRVMRGEVLHAQGKQAEVIAELTNPLPPAFRTSEAAVRRLVTLGFAALHLGKSAEAISRLNEARVIASAHQPQLLAEVYRGLAIVAPDLAHAEEYARNAFSSAKRYGDRRTEAKAMAALQWQYGRAERYADAILWGEKALALARELQLEKTVGLVEGNLGWQYIELGDYESAADLFTRAEAKAARIGAATERVSWLIQLGNLRVYQRDWAAADRYYRAAIAYGKPIKSNDVGKALANLAYIALELGRLDDARQFNAEALELKRQAKDTEGELRSLTLDARIAAAAGQLDPAVKTLQRVVAEAQQATTRWEAQGRLAQILANARQPASADKEFRHAIDTAREARRTITSTELRFGFFNTVQDVFGSYVDFLLDRGRIEDALAVTEIMRAQTLEEGLGLPAQERTRDVRAIAREQNATLLCYWLQPRKSYAWVVTPSSVTVKELPSDTAINADVDAYRRDLAGPRGTLQFSGSRGQQLYKTLVKTEIARGSRVIVIPDGNLHALNFETLVVATPKPHYWIEDVVLSEASSIQLLARRDAPVGAAPTMLLVGNPPPPDPSFPPLPRAADEMRSVARHFPAPRLKTLSGAAATPGAYRGATPERFDFVHFVAHGMATRTRPLESAVILARDANTSNYRLLAREIVKQPLKARLVTISSCHGAGTRAYAGEGLVGLAWAFLRAGASNVIAALWEVNDSATPQLMERFYAQTAAGADPAAALRDAKLSLLRSNGVYRYPRYWAPFVLYM
jgi:CHAT domain-containing protein/tetratricopeptide (TPR) repeat protein